jgi:hypothetical protein
MDWGLNSWRGGISLLTHPHHPWGELNLLYKVYWGLFGGGGGLKWPDHCKDYPPHPASRLRMKRAIPLLSPLWLLWHVSGWPLPLHYQTLCVSILTSLPQKMKQVCKYLYTWDLCFSWPRCWRLQSAREQQYVDCQKYWHFRHYCLDFKSNPQTSCSLGKGRVILHMGRTGYAVSVVNQRGSWSM